MSGIFKLSNAGGVTSKTRYPNMLTNYGDYGALQRIAYQTASGSVGQITFNNIPQTFQDLMLVSFTRDSKTGQTLNNLGFNINNALTTISETELRGDGASPTSSRNSANGYNTYGFMPAANATNGIFGSQIMHIFNYANTATNKIILSRSAMDLNGSGIVDLFVNMWASTAAVTRLDLFVYGAASNFVSGSTFALYGVKASNA